LVQPAEVIDDRQDKGGAAEKEGAQAEPLVIKDDLLEAAVNGQIELLEHTPESGVGTGVGVGLIVNEEGHEWVPDGDHELKRVKVRKACPFDFPSFNSRALHNI
jgi:protein phosphatase-4 regulatory subunit 3